MSHSSFHPLFPNPGAPALSRAEADAILTAIQRELETARDVQSRFFPKQFPRLPDLDYCGDCIPVGAVGGDLFDFVPLRGSALVAAVGDVSGKGIPAAILMAGVQASLKNLAAGQLGLLSEVAEELNHITCDVCPDNAYVTLFYAQLDPANRKLHYVSAGHESALLVRSNPDRVRRLDSTGTVLGLTRSASYRQRTISIEPSDVLVAFTDGITEALDPRGRAFGEVGVLQAVRQNPDAKASDLVGGILAAVEEFTEEQAAGDDKTVVVVRYTGAANEDLAHKRAADRVLTAA